MKIYKFKVKAYAVLVKGGRYILDESERTNPQQELVPEKYRESVAESLVEEGI